MKLLEGLKWVPSWMSLMGCVKGCLDFLGRDLPREWIAGGCGHAFALNVHEVMCPSGPTAWKTERVHGLGRNVGWSEQTFLASKNADDFEDKQREAFETVCAHIDQGLPAYGWEMPIPEHYVICGYDDEGYLVSGPGRKPEDGAVPWHSVGCGEIGVLEISTVSLCEPAHDGTVVHEALALALELAAGGHSLDNWTMGLGAFDLWAAALEEGKANRFGLGYNAECWAECRAQAAEFLREAKLRLPGRGDELFDRAADAYSRVHKKLAAVRDAYPFRGNAEREPDVRDAEAAALVREAKMAEEEALAAVRELLATV